ncbi:hypothetical protein [Aquisphaera insulae]|uniref:hypothetical protein n=1 Tax=Aquisphaera insulae TaxID=2712864 RepID=UPI0013E9A81A|nr:hypothetical protein [Aquisphaera insulae]
MRSTAWGLSILVWYSLLVGSAVLGAVGDILLFQWAKRPNGWALSAGFLIWISCLVLMAIMFRLSTLSFGPAIVLFVVIHLIIDLLWDAIVLESVLTPAQWVGVALAVAAILLLQFGRNSP